MPTERNEAHIVKCDFKCDVNKVASRIKQIWIKVTDAEIAHYVEGRRGVFLQILQKKYQFTIEQAENVLSNIERLTL